MDFSSLVIYAIFMQLSVSLAFVSRYSTPKYHFLLVLVTYLLVVSFWALRHDIGFDYENYTYIFYEIKNGYSSYVEPAYYLLCRIFSRVDGGEYYVIGAMSMLTYTILFYFFLRKNILWQGLLFSLVFQFQFMAANQIRQALAICVFFLILPYIEKKQTLKWGIGVGIIALVCHTSAIFLFLLIPLCRINLSGKKWCFIISILYILYLEGVFRSLGNFLLLNLPLPENYQHFLATDRVEAEVIGFSLVMLFNVAVALYVAWNYVTEEKRIFSLYMIGICLYIVFVEYHLLLRLSFYLFYINLYVVSSFCKEKKSGRILVIISVIFFLFICAQSTNMHGVIPYKSLLAK
ncbi:EpsG family protein [Bacteroides clarus]|uniref:EpsG family protein n=2 Tax=Bacteroides clarus TaxID=626929 RepID=UPI0018A9544A|nr:EpsG family protein [Bacteroides clarus]